MLTSKPTGIDDLAGQADPAQSVPLHRRKALEYVSHLTVVLLPAISGPSNLK
jgi:hypothetical protein